MNLSFARSFCAITTAIVFASAPLVAFATDAGSAQLREDSTTQVHKPAPGSSFVNAFVKKWSGKYVDVDKAYGNQCWDLAAQYGVELGYGWIQTGGIGAREIYEKFNSNGNAKYYNRVANTPDNFPNPGDVVVWNNTFGGGYGHVAIVVSANAKTLNVLEQNSPTGGAIRVHTYNYNGVLGWLRPKKFA